MAIFNSYVKLPKGTTHKSHPIVTIRQETKTQPGSGRSATLVGHDWEKLAVPLGHWTQDFPRWQRWKIFGKWLGKCLVKGWFKVSLGMCICLCLSTYISLSVPVTSFGLENAKIIKIEKWKKWKMYWFTKSRKSVNQKKANSDCSFLFRVFSSVFVDFYFFFHYCFPPFFKVFFNFKLLHQKKMCTTKKIIGNRKRKNAGKTKHKKKCKNKAKRKQYEKYETKGSNLVRVFSALFVKCCFSLLLVHLPSFKANYIWNCHAKNIQHIMYIQLYHISVGVSLK